MGDKTRQALPTESEFKRNAVLAIGAASLLALTNGCLFHLKEGEGGGQTKFDGPRKVNAEAIALPSGYVIRPVVTGLTFPTGITFDDEGRLYVTEAGYSYGNAVTTPRLLRVDAAGKLEEIARGDNPPWNGVAFHQGSFYIAGGHIKPGQVLRVDQNRNVTVLADDLMTSVGDHQVNGPVVRDGFVYFSQGPLTNSAVVGMDNFHFGWVKRYPEAHDIPCKDIVVAERNYTTPNPLTDDPDDKAVTGPYMPFGVPVKDGQVIPGKVPCGGAVMRVPIGGGDIELVAWGLRNPWGMAFDPKGQLYVTENQYDVRGSRPVFGTGDLLWKITPGAWYGWPDYWAEHPLTDEGWFKAPGEQALKFVMKEHPGKPPKPAARFGVHSSSNGIDFSTSSAFGHEGQAFVAQFGDIAPTVGKVLAPVGFKVVRVEVDTGVVYDFAVNIGETNGPGSWLGTGGLERPVNVRFSPDGKSLYVVDFGVMTTKDGTLQPRKGTGVVWKIDRSLSGEKP